VSGAAFGLALAAAAIHALWNVVLARERDTQAAAAVALLVSMVVFAPVAAVVWRIQWSAAPYIAASATLELAYFALLIAAYERAEMSVVYPIARGLAPVLVLAFGIAIGTGTSASQAAGVCLVGAGVLAVRGLPRAGDPRAGGLALAVAVCIAGYTLVDKHGIRHANPIVYLELVEIPMALAYAGMVARRRGAAVLRSQIGPTAVFAGVAQFGAYLLVLAALRLAAAAPVAAVRETSVVIAALLAGWFLHERVTWVRIAGAAVVAGGVAILAGA
jgi:drug/metabolite transporter (DMT)-like permease